jgi:hypothetical protein
MKSRTARIPNDFGISEHNHEVNTARQVVSSATAERANRLKPFRQVNAQRSGTQAPSPGSLITGSNLSTSKFTVPQHIGTRSKIVSVTSGKAGSESTRDAFDKSDAVGLPKAQSLREAPTTIGGNQPKKNQVTTPEAPVSLRHAKDAPDGRKHGSSSNHDDCEPITDARAQEILSLWQIFPGAAILVPASASGGAPVITHQMEGPPLKINGLLIKSALGNNALYGFECAEAVDLEDDGDDDSCDRRKSKKRTVHKYVNLYEVMIPDIPGKNGEISTADFYSHRLHELGLRVHGDHFHWKGSSIFDEDKLVNAVHHYSDQHTPEEFSRLTIQALTETMELIEQRTVHDDSDQDHNEDEYTD